MPREISPYKGVAKQAAKMAAAIREKGYVKGLVYSVPDGRVSLLGSALVGRKQDITSMTQDGWRTIEAIAGVIDGCRLHGHECSWDRFPDWVVEDWASDPQTPEDDVLAILDLLAETA